jgi:hypothetical protein
MLWLQNRDNPYSGVSSMGFQIVELEMDGEVIRQRKVVAIPFPTRDEAIRQVETTIGNYASNGYCREQGYWWFRALDGDTSRFVIEGVQSLPPVAGTRLEVPADRENHPRRYRAP